MGIVIKSGESDAGKEDIVKKVFEGEQAIGDSYCSRKHLGNYGAIKRKDWHGGFLITGRNH